MYSVDDEDDIDDMNTDETYPAPTKAKPMQISTDLPSTDEAPVQIDFSSATEGSIMMPKASKKILH